MFRLAPSALLFLLFFFSDLIQAQDTVFLKNGSTIEGSYKVVYNFQDDHIEADYSSHNITAKEIDYIILQSGIILYSFEFDYFDRKEKTEITKFGFFREWAEGEISLYSYKGKMFSFAIRKNSFITPLQKLSFEDNSRTSIQNFKTVLLTNFGNNSCLENEQIFKIRLTLNSLLFLTNIYNKCSNPDYKPIHEASVKKIYNRYGAGIGINSSSLEMNVSVSRWLGGRGYEKIGDLFSDKEQSLGYAFQAYYQRSVFGTWNLFWETKVMISLNRFNIYTEPDLDLKTEKLVNSDLTLLTGFNYPVLNFKKLDLEFGVGAFAWALIHQKPVTIPAASDLGYGGSKKFGLGGYISPRIIQSLSQHLSIVYSIEFLKRLDTQIYTYHEEYYRYDEDDHFSRNVLFLIKLRYSGSFNRI